MQKKDRFIYFISGLGAGPGMFEKLELPPGYKPRFINWIEPLPKEPLKGYANRLLMQIDTSQEFILAGLSFGGIIAVEIARLKKPQCLLLISSVSSFTQLPYYYRLAGSLGLHRLIPAKFFLAGGFLKNYFFGAASNQAKKLLASTLASTNPGFLKWAIDAILKWDGKNTLPSLFHIHGRRDKILPLKFIKADKIVEEGGHLMVFENATEVTSLIGAYLEKH